MELNRPPSRRCRDRSWATALATFLALLTPVVWDFAASAQAPLPMQGSAAMPAANSVPAPPTEEPADNSIEDGRARRRAMAGLAAVAGIAIVGISLMALIIIWGRRLRRLNRQPLPASPLKDELWFLKPSSTAVDSRIPGDDSASDASP